MTIWSGDSGYLEYSFGWRSVSTKLVDTTIGTLIDTLIAMNAMNANDKYKIIEKLHKSRNGKRRKLNRDNEYAIIDATHNFLRKKCAEAFEQYYADKRSERSGSIKSKGVRSFWKDYFYPAFKLSDWNEAHIINVCDGGKTIGENDDEKSVE
jgi:hypothetical protein